MGKFPYLYNVGDEVVAKRDTRVGVMAVEPAHVGRVGKVVSVGQMGGQAFYELSFDGRIDFADHCTLSGLDVV
jgi:hypothetical protein